jgi:hypothetical protein
MDATIKQKVQEFVDRKEMFTSVDISNAIKKDGIWIRNAEVRNWLRANSRDPNVFDGYSSSAISVCGGNTDATLYHPSLGDPDDYQARDQQPLTPYDVKAIQKQKVGQPIPAAAPDIGDVLSTRTDDADMVAVIKSKERVKIPGNMIKALGWKIGDTIDPAVIKTHRVIRATLKVGKDHRVSVPRSAINWGTDPVKVMLKGGTIVFEKA